MKIICEECGREFDFSTGEQKFYASKGFHEPKRCHECRKFSASSIVGLKRNSFCDFLSACVAPACVNGGRPTVEYVYIIALDGKEGRLYFAVKDRKLIWVKKEEDAAVFTHWTIAKANIEKLSNYMKISKEKFIAVPFAHWAPKMHVGKQ